MIILGIDPSLNSCGYAILNCVNNSVKLLECGHIKHSKDIDTNQKILAIYFKVKSLAQKYNPNIFAIEETFVNSNAQTSLKLGMVRGACLCSINEIENIKIFEYEPKLVKKTITGNGNADKNQIIYMLKVMLPGSTYVNDDESDAVAVAITAYLNNS